MTPRPLPHSRLDQLIPPLVASQALIALVPATADVAWAARVAWDVARIAAWPSMDPASPLSACCRAAASRRRRANSRNATATSTIMIGPPTNSARVNCHESSSAMMMPSSITRFVLAISKTIAAVKLAPRRNRARARATAA